MRDVRNDIIDLFEKGIFRYRGNVFKTKEELEKSEQWEESEESEELEENKSFNYIENKSKGIDHDLFKKYFDFKTATHLTKKTI